MNRLKRKTKLEMEEQQIEQKQILTYLHSVHNTHIPTITGTLNIGKVFISIDTDKLKK
eukprot:Ihof_evm4s186 gene=Ihof_evmTU4s186